MPRLCFSSIIGKLASPEVGAWVMLFLTMSCVSASSWAPFPQQAGLALSKHRSRHQAPQCHWVCQCQGQKPVASFASHNLAMHKAPTMCTPGCQEGEGASSMHLAKARLSQALNPGAEWWAPREQLSGKVSGKSIPPKGFWEEAELSKPSGKRQGFQRPLGWVLLSKASGKSNPPQGFWEEVEI